MPLGKNVRFRYKWLNPYYRQRLAFKNGKVVEVTGYFKRSGKWTEAYNRKLPKMRNK
jgi:hypothetical protein